MKLAGDFLSARVVAVGPEQRLADVAEAIVAKDALYCAVVSRTGTFLGLVRLKDIAASSPDRIFADLAPSALPLDINEKMEIGLAIRLLRSQGADALVVVTREGRYLGLVTRESVFALWDRE